MFKWQYARRKRKIETNEVSEINLLTQLRIDLVKNLIYSSAQKACIPNFKQPRIPLCIPSNKQYATPRTVAPRPATFSRSKNLLIIIIIIITAVRARRDGAGANEILTRVYISLSLSFQKDENFSRCTPVPWEIESAFSRRWKFH